MNITLISPFPDVYSFGVRSISASAKQAGHRTKILFLTQEFTEPYSTTVLDQVVSETSGSDLVGISLMSNFWDNSVALTRVIRDRLNIPVVWGGIHPTIRPKECLVHADHVLVGEAEFSFVELLENLGSGKPTPGVWSRGQQGFEKATPPADLDQLPPADFDLSTHLVLCGQELVPMNSEILRARTKGIYLTIPSRGCPFNCTYCCNVFLNQEFPENRKVRRKSMPVLIQELESVLNQLPVFDRIKFDDDAFFSLPLKEIEEFSQMYKQRIGLPLIVTGVTPSTVQKEKVQTLVDAGMVEVRMGIESASESMRKEYKRPQTERKVLQAAQLLNEYRDHLTPYYDMIIDNPWESDESLVESLRFLARLPMPYELILYSLTFYPGTDVYDRARAEGIIQDDVQDVYRKYYHSFKPTYLNDLYVVLTHYAHWREPFPPGLMDLITSKAIRKLPFKQMVPKLLLERLRWILRIRNWRQRWKKPDTPQTNPELTGEVAA